MSEVTINRRWMNGPAQFRGLAPLFAIALLLLAVSCGGGSFALPEDNPGGDGPLMVAGGELPVLPQDGAGQPSRSASAIETIPGSAAIMVANGTVVDMTLVLQSPAIAPEPGQDIAWGLYQVSGLAGKQVTTLAINAIPGGLDQQYSVGVSNFSEGVWDFLQTTSLPEFEYDLSAEESRLVSRLGNLYFIVVVSGGDSATVVQASVISQDVPTGGLGLPPAMGGKPQASEGLSDRIVVTWDPIDGAESYELWRAEDVEGLDEQFSMLAAQNEMVFTDLGIQLGIEYKYKVRGINIAGAGQFGNEDSGWAGSVRPVGEGEEFGEKEEFGTIAAIDSASLTVNEVLFAIDENTKWMGDNGLPTDPAQFVVGTVVEVHGKSDGAGGWLATRVELEDYNFGQEREVYGAIEAISATEIVVGGETFMLNGATEWLDDNNLPIDPALFVVGTFVEVDAYADGAGGWLAEKVKFDDGQGGGEGTFEIGNIEALDATTITVNGVVFAHNASTEWLDNNNLPLSLGDFSVGMYVKVEADPDGMGGWIAYKVKMEDQGGGTGTFEIGNIEALDATTIIVNGVVFSHDANTEWLDNNNLPLSIGDFSVGMYVKVEADPDGMGGWLAYKVKIEDQQGASHDELGLIQELTATTITVNDVVFTITAQTEWLDNDNNPLTQGDFSVGELVQVEGTVLGETITADKVKKEN